MIDQLNFYGEYHVQLAQRHGDEHCTNKFDQWPIPGLGADECKNRSTRAINLRLTRFVEWVLPLGAEGGTIIFGSEVDTIVSLRVDFNVFLDSILGVMQQIKMI